MVGPDRATTAARQVVFGYAAVAASWILLSDTAFSLIGGPTLSVWGNIAKGLLFVAVTTLVLDRLVVRLYRREASLADDVRRQAELRAALFNLSPEAMWVYDPESLQLLEVNDTMVERYGRSRDELLTMRTTDLGPTDGGDRVVHRATGGDRRADPVLWLHFGPHGEHRWVEVVSHRIAWEGRTALLALSRDVTAQKRAEEALRSSERRLAGVLSSMQEMAFSVDLVSGRIVYLNDVAVEVLGRDPATELRSLDDFASIVVPDDWALYVDAMRKVVKEGWAEVEYRICLPDDTTRLLHVRARGVIGPSGRVEHVDGVAIDTTNRQELVELVEHQRSFDQLTGLPNRASFVQAVDAMLAGGTIETPPAVVAMFGLARFSSIVQSSGHYAGDAVLVSTAERVASVLEPGMILARVGGDEFAVFSPPGAETADELVLRLQGAVEDAFMVGDYEFFVSISVGLAECDDSATSAEEILRNAHLAMTAAKDRTAGVEHFHPAYRASITDQVRVENELRHAIQEGQLVPFYQPQVSLATDRMVGVEALARWRHPERGWLAAVDFIQVAERSALIGDLDDVILRQACAQAVLWRERFEDLAPRVWVNLSRRELDTADITGRVLKALAEHGLPPEAIGVEVTETAFVADGTPGLVALREMAASGVDIALDDFGTGWSSLQTLKSFPLSIVKIDRSFITNVGVSVTDTQITKAVIGMAKGMSLLTLAEGVETGEQLTHLRKLGCDQVQGYLLGRPSPATKIDEILEGGGKPTVFYR